MDNQQKRLFLALILCAGVAVLWQMFIFSPPQRQPDQTAEGTGDESAQEQPAEQVTEPTEGTGEVAQIAPVEQVVPETEVLPPQRFQGRDFWGAFSNVGATLPQFGIEAPEQYIPRDDFGGVFPHGAESHFPFGVTVEGLPHLVESTAFELIESESSTTTSDTQPWASAPSERVYDRVVYRWNDGNIEITKAFAAADASYTTDFTLTFRDLSGQGRHIDGAAVHVWTDAQHGETGGVFNPIANTVEAACYVHDDLEKKARDKIEDQEYAGPTYWAGVQDRYFLTAAAISDASLAHGCHFRRDENHVASTLLLSGFDIAPGESRTFELTIYIGPKDADALDAAGSFLDRSVSYGMFSFLAYPMKWVLKAFHGFSHNWGIAIILLTMVVKILLFFPSQKSYKSMERMKAIQPKLTDLREKHKNDKSKLTEETMRLYREHNVNPFGCLPMLLQIPIYIALYRTIYSSVELYKADFALWINDLSKADPYYILPVLMAATMFGQQLLMPTTTDNPQMKWVMRLMPIMFGFFMLVLPSGLVLYIFVSSLLGFIQQWLIRRQFAREREGDAGGAAPSDQQTRQQRRQAARRQGT